MSEKVSRYKAKRRTPIALAEFMEMVERVGAIPDGFILDSLARRSLVAALFYSGLRVGEVVGDSARRWRALTPLGLQLSRTPEGLRRDWMEAPAGELWGWRHRGGLPGIVKEDIRREGQTLYISSAPLKHGRREDPLELSLSWPHVDLIRLQWARAAEGGRVWPISQTSARGVVSSAGEGCYPHAFRSSLATTMARDSTISVGDMLGWFGWARSATADAYLMAQRSRARARASIGRMVRG